MSILPSVPGPLHLRDVFARIPDQAEHLIGFYQMLMRGPSPLTPGERELIYSYASKENGCHFCHTSHRHCAVTLGIPEAAFAVPPAALATAPLRPAMRDLLRFGVTLAVLGPGRRRLAADARAALPAGRNAMLDTVLVAGLTAFINRLVDGMGASLPDERHAENGRNLALHGYAAVQQEVGRGLRAAGHPPPPPMKRVNAKIPASAMPRARILRWLAAYQALVFTGPSGLPLALRHAIRTRIARGNGVTPPAAPKSGRVPSPAAADRRATGPVLDFAVRLGRTVRQTRPEDVQAIYAAGWTERDLIDAVLVAATASFADRVAIGLPLAAKAKPRAPAKTRRK